jgi:hypothetical protein
MDPEDRFVTLKIVNDKLAAQPIMDEILQRWEDVANIMIKKFMASKEFEQYTRDVFNLGHGKIDIGKWVLENFDDTNKT